MKTSVKFSAWRVVVVVMVEVVNVVVVVVMWVNVVEGKRGRSEVRGGVQERSEITY